VTRSDYVIIAVGMSQIRFWVKFFEIVVVVRGVICLICLSRLEQQKKKEIFNQIRFESEDKEIKKKL